MKILFANNYAYTRGGTERVLIGEMELLDSRGIQSVLFSRNHPENFSWETEVFFPSHFDYMADGAVNKMRSAKTLIFSPEAAVCFTALVKQEKPDLLHAHNIYGRLTTSILQAASKAGLPIVQTLHDYKLLCPSCLFMRAGNVCESCLEGGAIQCLIRRCHKGSYLASAVYTAETYFSRFLKMFDGVRYFICPSKFIMQKHIQGGIRAEKLVYLPNFIDFQSFEPEFEAGGYLLYVGRLSREKGIKTLLQAMSGLDIPLKLVGEGPLENELQELIHKERLKQVLFEGKCSGKKLKELYQNAAFLIIPSECYENAPMSVLEANGYGKPVIGADIGGIPEMIEDGETGLLFPAGDSQILREKILWMWSRPEVIQQMGRSARERAEKKYNSILHYERLMDVYRQAMS